MIGIIGAMESECAFFKSNIKNKKVKVISDIEFVSGDMFGKEVVVAKCGIGKVFAALCAQTMILEYRPDVIINTGVAGSLSKELSVTDIAIANGFVQHDMDTSAIGDPVGLISGINIVLIPTDEKVTAALERAVELENIPHSVGTVASGDTFVAKSEDKLRIAERFGAVACEMEGGAIAQVCYVNHVPYSAVRAISDNADGNSELDYPTFVKVASDISARVIGRFLKEAE